MAMDISGIGGKIILSGTGMALDKGDDLFKQSVDSRKSEPTDASGMGGDHESGLGQSFKEGFKKSIADFGKQLVSPLKNGLEGGLDAAKGLGDLAMGDKAGAKEDFKSAGQHAIRGGIDGAKNAVMLAPIVLTGGAAAAPELAAMTGGKMALNVGQQVAMGQAKSAIGHGLGNAAKNEYEQIKAKL